MALILVQRYSRDINSFDPSAIRLLTHQQIVSGEAVDPYRFRVLVPEAMQWIWVSGPFANEPVWLDRLYFVFFGGCFVAMFLLIRIMLTQLGWSPGESLVGPLLLATVLPVAFANHDFQPWSWLEALLVPFVYILALRRSPLWIFLLVAFVATFNRETAVALALIPFALSIQNWHDSKIRFYYLSGTAAIVVIWALVRLTLLTIWPGPASQRAISIEQIWERNLNVSGTISLQWGGWVTTLFTISVFAGGILVAALVGVKSKKCPVEALWIAAFTLPPLIAAWLVFAIWIEVRVLLPVLIIALPLALSAFTPMNHGKRESLD